MADWTVSERANRTRALSAAREKRLPPWSKRERRVHRPSCPIPGWRVAQSNSPAAETQPPRQHCRWGMRRPPFASRGRRRGGSAQSTGASPRRRSQPARALRRAPARPKGPESRAARIAPSADHVPPLLDGSQTTAARDLTTSSRRDRAKFPRRCGKSPASRRPFVKVPARTRHFSPTPVGTVVALLRVTRCP